MHQFARTFKKKKIHSITYVTHKIKHSSFLAPGTQGISQKKNKNKKKNKKNNTKPQHGY